MCPDDGASAVAAVLAHARAAYAAGDIDGAEAEYRRAMAMEPHDPEAAYQLAAILEDRGDYEAASDAYRIAVAQGDENAPVELALLLMERLDRLKEAEEFIRLGLEREDQRAFVGLGKLRSKQGRISEAEEAFQHAIDAGEAYGYIGLGEMLMEKEARDEALRQYRRALSYNHAQAKKQLSSVNGGIDDVAMQWFDGVRASVVEALLELGREAREVGDWDVAEAAYWEASEQGDIKAQLSYANLLALRGGRDNEVENAYRQALEMGDNSPEAAYKSSEQEGL